LLSENVRMKIKYLRAIVPEKIRKIAITKLANIMDILENVI